MGLDRIPVFFFLFYYFSSASDLSFSPCIIMSSSNVFFVPGCRESDNVRVVQGMEEIRGGY